MSLYPMLGPARVLAVEPPLRLPFPDTCVWGQAALEDGGGKMAGGGSPRNPTSGHAAPHPWQWRGGHPAEVWLWHRASQAVAPMKAMSCEAAPRLGVTISPATQSKGKTSPSSSSVISMEGAGMSVWEQHHMPDQDMLPAKH